MLISDILTDVLGDVGADITDSENQAKALGWIKSVLRRFPLNIRSRSLIIDYPFTLPSTGQVVTLPSGFIQEKEFWYISAAKREPITMVRDTKIFNQHYQTSPSGAPQYARIISGGVEFDKPADQAYSCYLEYFKEIDNVSASDTFAHNSNIAEIVKDGIKFYYYVWNEQDADKAFWAGLFEKGLLRIDSEYARQEQPDYVEES